jgi:protein-S-isoprenylcysteine O-methyltransferase Ste14
VSASRIPQLGSRGEGWVVLQVVLFGLVAVAGLAGPIWSGPVRVAGVAAGALLILAGVYLAGRGIVDLRENLTPFPKPMDGGHLVDTGAYRLARHPIYGGGITAAFGWGLVTASPPAVLAALLLGVFFDLKSRREEIWLAEAFPGYPAYRSRTRRLVPWVY